jgi:signal transduction histidine kinase
LHAHQLRIDISDDGPGLSAEGIPADGRGVGLRNTRDRLSVLYGSQARLDGRNLEQGCVIELTLPAEAQS